MRNLTVLYDEGCAFCMRVAGWLNRAKGISIVPIGARRGSELLGDLTLEERYASVHVVDEQTGRRRSGGAALPPLLRSLPGGRLPARLLERFPGVSAWGYRLVSEHRALLERFATRASRGRAG